MTQLTKLHLTAIAAALPAINAEVDKLEAGAMWHSDIAKGREIINRLAAEQTENKNDGWTRNLGVIPCDVGTSAIDLIFSDGTIMCRELAYNYVWHKHFAIHITNWRLSR